MYIMRYTYYKCSSNSLSTSHYKHQSAITSSSYSSRATFTLSAVPNRRRTCRLRSGFSGGSGGEGGGGGLITTTSSSFTIVSPTTTAIGSDFAWKRASSLNRKKKEKSSGLVPILMYQGLFVVERSMHMVSVRNGAEGMPRR